MRGAGRAWLVQHPDSGTTDRSAGQKAGFMSMIRGFWKLLRGMSLLVFLAVVFTGVLLLSGLARLLSGDGFSSVAGRPRQRA
jgi:hypothetical protein